MNAKKLPGPSADVNKGVPAVEAWYINEDSVTDKATCMETQLTEAGYAPLRFSALQTASQDCVESGIEEMPDLSEAEK